MLLNLIDRHQQWDHCANTYELAIRSKIRPRSELKTRYLEIQERARASA